MTLILVFSPGTRGDIGGGVGPAAIAEQIDPITEATLFVADHAAHLATVVRPALAAGKLVISDGSRTDRFAYRRSRSAV